VFGRKKKEGKKKTFIDLDGYNAPMYAPSDAKIVVVEVTSHRDLKALTDLAYRGNILILDFSMFEEGDSFKKEIAKRLLEVARDISGAFTEVSDILMVLSPSGLSIDKRRIVHREK
jgi:SepF-like predicted cell division protein (DUF552 family)